MKNKKLSKIYETKMQEELKTAKDLITKMDVKTDQLKNALYALKSNWDMIGIPKLVHQLSWDLANDSSNLDNAIRNTAQYGRYTKEALADEAEFK